MFCINCGQKVIDGAKFCLNCGINLENIQSENITGNQEELSADVPNMGVVLEKKPLNTSKGRYTKEEVIEKIFDDVFGMEEKYGNQIQIDIEYINEDELKNTLDTYKIKYPEEKPLLMYEYPDTKYVEGFVITNKRLVWRYGSTIHDSIPLDEIKNIEIGTSMLATVMYAISLDNIRYPKIYLLSIQNVQEFVMRFRKFISMIHQVLDIDVGQNKKMWIQTLEEKWGRLLGIPAGIIKWILFIASLEARQFQNLLKNTRMRKPIIIFRIMKKFS